MSRAHEREPIDPMGSRGGGARQSTASTLRSRLRESCRWGFPTPTTWPLIVDSIEHWRSRIVDKLTQARQANRLPGDVDLDSLADHVFTTFEGALARATDDPTHVRAQLGQLRRYLELLLGSAV